MPFKLEHMPDLRLCEGQSEFLKFPQRVEGKPERLPDHIRKRQCRRDVSEEGNKVLGQGEK